MTQRGDIVIVQFPYVSGTQNKSRPALVLQSDHNNRRLHNTIIAMITGNTSRAATEPTQVLIDPSAPEGKGSGLTFPSAVKCENIYTVPQANIHKSVGRLSPRLMQQIDTAIKASLAVA